MGSRARIRIITTGGTIGSRIDSSGGAVPAVSAEELVALTPGLHAVADVDASEFGRLQSWNIGVGTMVQLAAAVTEALKDESVEGVVVTHGTDTMEETAFALDLLVDPSKPVVLTGAMRNASESGFEGPRNLLAAAQVAASPASRGRGTMVVMNDEIHAARFVTKIDTTAFDTFASPECGAIGRVEATGVRFHCDLEHTPRLDPANGDARVYLVKMAAGTDDLLLRAVLGAHVEGVVLEASGAGNVPDSWHDAIRDLVGAQIPVVLVSRCLTGRIVPAYGGRGGGKTIQSLGVIDGGWLSGPKARVALTLALGSGLTLAKLKSFFTSVSTGL